MSPSLLFFQPITIVVSNRCGSARANDAGVDLVLIQPCCCYANYYFFSKVSIKKKEVCIKTRSTSASRPLKRQDTKPTT